MNLEQHIGELEALGSLSALRLCYRIGNGCQDFSTMTKGDADFLKPASGKCGRTETRCPCRQRPARIAQR
jgi:hypothetical protein